MSFNAQVPKAYEAIIKNDGFWPDIDLKKFMTTMRQDTRIDETIIRDAVVDAMDTVNSDLAGFVEQQRALKPIMRTVTDIDSSELDGRHRLVTLYQRAVYHRAKGTLLTDFADYSTTPQGLAGAERVDNHRRHADYYFAASLKALRHIKGQSGQRVTLVKAVTQGQPWEIC